MVRRKKGKGKGKKTKDVLSKQEKAIQKKKNSAKSVTDEEKTEYEESEESDSEEETSDPQTNAKTRRVTNACCQTSILLKGGLTHHSIRGAKQSRDGETVVETNMYKVLIINSCQIQPALRTWRAPASSSAPRKMKQPAALRRRRRLPRRSGTNLDR